MTNRLKDALKGMKFAPIDAPTPEGYVAVALPKPAMQMLRSVEHLLKIAPKELDDLTEQQCCHIGAVLTEIIVKAAAALEVMEQTHNEIQERSKDS